MIDSKLSHDHFPTQHRDGKQPWCNVCGLTKDMLRPISAFDQKDTVTDLSSRPEWDEYFIDISQVVASRADCRRRKVGAVIVDPYHRILSTGYNGAPSGQPGCLAGHCPRGLMTYEQTKEFSAYENCISTHAELNALLYARTSLVGCIIYITDDPCKACRKSIAASQITKIITPQSLINVDSEFCERILE